MLLLRARCGAKYARTGAGDVVSPWCTISSSPPIIDKGAGAWCAVGIIAGVAQVLTPMREACVAPPTPRGVIRPALRVLGPADKSPLGLISGFPNTVIPGGAVADVRFAVAPTALDGIGRAVRIRLRGAIGVCTLVAPLPLSNAVIVVIGAAVSAYAHAPLPSPTIYVGVPEERCPAIARVGGREITAFIAVLGPLPIAVAEAQAAARGKLGNKGPPHCQAVLYGPSFGAQTELHFASLLTFRASANNQGI